jgi:hypothetical protein
LSVKTFAYVLIREGIITSDQDAIDALKKIPFQGRAVNQVRQKLKDNYRDDLLDLIKNQATAELRYQKMREIGESLDVQSQGDFSETWYQNEFATHRIDANSGQPVPNTTQATLGTESAKKNYDIELETPENRRFDELFGDENSATIREHKHVSSKLGEEQITQFKDNIKIVLHNRKISGKQSQGIPLTQSPKDTPVIIEKGGKKGGKKFRPDKLMYTFATPEGAKANANWMGTELGNNKEYLSFEIVNSKGEIKTIDINNISELDEPALSQWLYPTINNSQNSP